MYIIPVILDENEVLMAIEPIPIGAIRTKITPEGCQVFMPTDIDQ